MADREASMASDSLGYLEYDDRISRFQSARCRWSLGSLDIEARGKGCWLMLVAVPFAGATGLTDLPGRTWEPDDDEMARCADTFMEGGLEIRGQRFDVVGSKITCRGYRPEKSLITIAFSLVVEGDETGGGGEVEGTVCCEVDSQ
jgi:hypothetical protein